MKKSLILIAFVTGCGASDQGNVSASQPAGATGGGGTAPAANVASTSLTGLYEGGEASSPSQLCVVEKGGTAHFGVVVWGPSLSACSGAGVITRRGDRLSLKMTGDQACTLEGSVQGGQIRLDRQIPAGCSYYCGARAEFAGAAFTQRGRGAADAMKAKDPAGDPLCSS